MATALVQRTAGRLPAVDAWQTPSHRRALLARLHAAVPTMVSAVDATPVRARISADVALVGIEGEDAKITGGTRSLTRRVLALNLPGSLRPVAVKYVPSFEDSLDS